MTSQRTKNEEQSSTQDKLKVGMKVKANVSRAASKQVKVPRVFATYPIHK